MGIPLFDLVHWGITTFIEVTILILAMRHRVFSLLLPFGIYLCALVADNAIMLLFYYFAGISSPASVIAYWTIQAVLVSLRAMLVYEVCRQLLSPYQGVWRLCRPFLITVAVILLVTGGAVARQNFHSLTDAIITSECGLELTIISMLIFGLLFCRYYGVSIERHLAWIAGGLGLYSAVQIGNSTFLQHWYDYFSVLHWLNHFLLWEGVRRFSFDVTLILWFMAVRKPLPIRKPRRVSLQDDIYEEVAPQLTTRLRELNARLLEIWK